MNLFATVLTHTAPSANYRGESAENRAVLQKITIDRFEYPIISPEAMRNALREILRTKGLPCNRARLDDEEQLAVKFLDYPDQDVYADDFFMGWLVAAGASDRKKIASELQKKGRDPLTFTYKQDSRLRMNMAVGLKPYRYNTVFTQSPKDMSDKTDKAHTNADSSQLLHRETVVTPYQYPFALNLKDCRQKAAWSRVLLEAVGELNDVAGNHARSYFEMAPASIVIRITPSLVAGYDSYGFTVAENGTHDLPEVLDGLLRGDYPGDEFLLGGKIVKQMAEETAAALKAQGVVLERSPQKLLATAAERAFPNA